MTGQPGEAIVALLTGMGIDPAARAETLTPEQFAELHRRVGEIGAGAS